MSTRLGRVAQMVGIVPAVYTVGFGLGGYLALKERQGLLTVVNREALLAPHAKGVLLIANHPSLVEPWVLIGLHSPQYLRNPWRTPWSTPDFGNFISHWYGQWLRVRCIPIPRGNDEKLRRAVDDIIAALARGETVIIFPEGGRTRSHKVKLGERHRVSPTGQRIRPFKIHRILERLPAGTEVLSAWIEREWDNREKVPHGLPDGFKPMTVVFDDPKELPAGLTSVELVHWCEDRVLALGDSIQSINSRTVACHESV